MIDTVALRSELLIDPAGLGFENLIEADNLGTVLDRINAKGFGKAPRGIISKDIFVGDVAGVVLALLTNAATNPNAVKWLTVYTYLIGQKDTINMKSYTTLGFLAGLVTDGFLTEDALNDLRVEDNSSRAEVLWGAGATVGLADIWRALERG